MQIYDDIYEITRATSSLSQWLKEKDIIGNLELIVGRITLKTRATTETASFGDALKRYVGTKFHSRTRI